MFVKILLPFNRHHVLFFGIAALACRYEIIPGASPPLGQGNDMVHSDILRRHLLPAIPTYGRSAFLLPPASLPQFSGLGLLTPHLRIGDTVKTIRIIHCHTHQVPCIFFHSCFSRRQRFGIDQLTDQFAAYLANKIK